MPYAKLWELNKIMCEKYLNTCVQLILISAAVVIITTKYSNVQDIYIQKWVQNMKNRMW